MVPNATNGPPAPLAPLSGCDGDPGVAAESSDCHPDCRGAGSWPASADPYVALGRLLEAWPGAAILVNGSGGSLAVHRVNAAASALLALEGDPGETLPRQVERIQSAGRLRPIPLAATGAPSEVTLLVGTPTLSSRLTQARSAWGLSPRQLEVLDLAVGGATNKAIANVLDISVSMVEQHVHVLFRRSSASCRAELIASFWRLS